ncbi:toprim domain-containing protein [Paracoccus sp. MBLB3053]|uniref:Toprim domain-containing protein n=1 Tax=Paracoccus aurantius TaxID=3073814 RepID=A0ABU2HTE1_9RHOB|nr:toprim domain-containing protein [Paracoccus sp. MBLB3053]MDS9467820.1 toprim domain-containing protein [Paracoccus sp. MBLB3053]
MRYNEEGRLWFWCHRSGCRSWDIIQELRRLRLWPIDQLDPDEARRRISEHEQRQSDRAKQTWEQAQPIEGTPGEAYFRLRGLSCPLPPSLRFHPALYHGAVDRCLPAIVAFVRGGPPAIHRIYIDQHGRKAAVDNIKMSLGPVSGGHVPLRFGDLSKVIVAEGIENGLALMCDTLADYFGHDVSVWSALSSSGMAALRLPDPDPGDQLLIAPDADEAGMAAASQLAAAALGWRVQVIPAPQGMDWNDLIKEPQHG